jgi:hypothetical protein
MEDDWKKRERERVIKDGRI